MSDMNAQVHKEF